MGSMHCERHEFIPVLSNLQRCIKCRFETMIDETMGWGYGVSGSGYDAG